MNPSTDTQTREEIVFNADCESTDRLDKAARDQTPAEILALCGEMATKYDLTPGETAYLVSQCLL